MCAGQHRGGYLNDFYAREFWRFVPVQQRVAELAKTPIEFPPMQAPASFNLEAVNADLALARIMRRSTPMR
jgi:arylsulfatase